MTLILSTTEQKHVTAILQMVFPVFHKNNHNATYELSVLGAFRGSNSDKRISSKDSPSLKEAAWQILDGFCSGKEDKLVGGNRKHEWKYPFVNLAASTETHVTN